MDAKHGPIGYVKARTHFVASLSAKHIHSAWDCQSDAGEARRDLTGWGKPLPGVTDYRVYTRATMERMGLVKGVR